MTYKKQDKVLWKKPFKIFEICYLHTWRPWEQGLALTDLLSCLLSRPSFFPTILDFFFNNFITQQAGAEMG